MLSSRPQLGTLLVIYTLGTSAKVYADNKSETYDVYFQEFKEFTLVYAVIS